MVISVTGAFRTGKSFLLNYLLLYLRQLEEAADTDGNFADDNWLKDDNEELTGFVWRRGAGKYNF